MFFKIRLVICPSCGYHFSARDSDGSIAKAPDRVLYILATSQQRCPNCKKIFAPRELLREDERERLYSMSILKNRTITCSLCGQTGHNIRTCDRRPADAKVDEEDLFDDDGFCNEDLGLCPHGCSDDEGCEEHGCSGGPAGNID
ncbi:hypothetical protein HZB94_05150 [Candidatus Falkowbacteria bacterium]|nr:hypothetical protein [Candidatus Falkowbacteria bacterium]